MKNTYRFFVAPAALAGDALDLRDPDLARQLARVLRLGPGDRIEVLDGAGQACLVELAEVGRERVLGRVVERGPAGGEPALALELYLALIRPERFEWALQKATELGVARIVPVGFARSLPADRADERRLERWRRIVREAAEQAGRGRLPAVEAPLAYPAALERAAAGPALLLWEGAAPPLRERLRALAGPPARLALLSGPEGGVAPEELTAAEARGIMPASLGPRTLRAETAPLAAAAAVFYEFDESAGHWSRETL